MNEPISEEAANAVMALELEEALTKRIEAMLQGRLQHVVRNITREVLQTDFNILFDGAVHSSTNSSTALSRYVRTVVRDYAIEKIRREADNKTNQLPY